MKRSIKIGLVVVICIAMATGCAQRLTVEPSALPPQSSVQTSNSCAAEAAAVMDLTLPDVAAMTIRTPDSLASSQDELLNEIAYNGAVILQSKDQDIYGLEELFRPLGASVAVCGLDEDNLPEICFFWEPTARYDSGSGILLTVQPSGTVSFLDPLPLTLLCTDDIRLYKTGTGPVLALTNTINETSSAGRYSHTVRQAFVWMKDGTPFQNSDLSYSEEGVIGGSVEKQDCFFKGEAVSPTQYLEQRANYLESPSFYDSALSLQTMDLSDPNTRLEEIEKALQIALMQYYRTHPFPQ